MKRRIGTLFLFIFFFFSGFQFLISQDVPQQSGLELDATINRALDLFEAGDYEKSIALLESVLAIDPENKRAKDMLDSVRALYALDTGKTDNSASGSGETTKPDFSISTPPVSSGDGTDQNGGDSVTKPDFSVRDDKTDIVLPEDTRSRFELSLSPNFVFPWSIGEDSVVFPSDGSYSGSFTADMNMYLNKWNRIVGFSGTYSLFLLNPQWGGFADGQLHVVDALLSFRTFFLEDVQSRVVFQLSAGYRGYFSKGYEFYQVNRNYLNGFNMGINLEGPFVYLFWKKDFFRKIIFDVDMNLLFFPEINTLNLFDFQMSVKYRFSHFAAGIHAGAYSVITPTKGEYIWMSGIDFNLFF